ncbi:MAG TPA: MDR family oxidoreductase [Bryobacteraceae bacterium]
MCTFKALLATQEGGNFRASIQEVPRESLPSGEVLVRVRYSSLNYKDGLAVTGRPGVIRRFPMVCGIDFAGVVEESASPEFKSGDAVALTGAGASETIWGGYAQYARWNAQTLVPLPPGMSLKQAMAIGTAGFTAMQCVMALERHGVSPQVHSEWAVRPNEGGEVVVTGASGGVGSIAIAILGKLGIRAIASTGRPELGDYLRSLGASGVIDRSELSATPGRALERERWNGAIDTVGGTTLAGLLPAIAVNRAIALCGLAGGAVFTTTVMPFILRGVSLLGINSVYVTPQERREVWDRLSRDLPLDLLDSMTEVAPLDRVIELGKRILEGKIRGRVVIDVG